jgi:hypothetical protein
MLMPCMQQPAQTQAKSVLSHRQAPLDELTLLALQRPQHLRHTAAVLVVSQGDETGLR